MPIPTVNGTPHFTTIPDNAMSSDLRETIVLTLTLIQSISLGSRDESAGRATPGMGRGHPGRRSDPAMGEAMVPGCISGRHYNPLHVSLLFIVCISATS